MHTNLIDVMKYSSFQVLALYDSMDTINIEKVVEFIKNLQQEDGSFIGDKWGKLL